MNDYNCYKYSQKCLARFIGILARGLKRPNPNDSKVQLIWRDRSTQQWDHLDVEKLLFPDEYLRNNSIFNKEYDDNDNNDDKDNYLQMNIEILRQINLTSKTNINVNNPIHNYVHKFESLFNNIFMNKFLILNSSFFCSIF